VSWPQEGALRKKLDKQLDVLFEATTGQVEVAQRLWNALRVSQALELSIKEADAQVGCDASVARLNLS
jgi:hypothetical protein